jgi:hypothetical protein
LPFRNIEVDGLQDLTAVERLRDSPEVKRRAALGIFCLILSQAENDKNRTSTGRDSLVRDRIIATKPVLILP